jgi:hypothetical protein
VRTQGNYNIAQQNKRWHEGMGHKVTMLPVKDKYGDKLWALVISKKKLKKVM